MAINEWDVYLDGSRLRVQYDYVHVVGWHVPEINLNLIRKTACLHLCNVSGPSAGLTVDYDLRDIFFEGNTIPQYANETFVKQTGTFRVPHRLFFPDVLLPSAWECISLGRSSHFSSGQERCFDVTWAFDVEHIRESLRKIAKRQDLLDLLAVSESTLRLGGIPQPIPKFLLEVACKSNASYDRVFTVSDHRGAHWSTTIDRDTRIVERVLEACGLRTVESY